MKTKCLFAWIIIGLLIVLGIYLFKRHTERVTQDYELRLSEYHLQVDSLKNALNEVEPRIDTVNVYIEKIVLQKVVVFEKLKTMPAVNQVALFDSITGEHAASRIIADSGLVITPMPRIVKALEVMVIADLLSQENDFLYEKLDLQQQKIETLVALNYKHEEMIYVQNATISHLKVSYDTLKESNKWLMYGVGALILMVLVK
jgi:hypothetical protein